MATPSTLSLMPWPDTAPRICTEIRREGERLVRQAREHLAGPELLAVEARYQTFINAVKR